MLQLHEHCSDCTCQQRMAHKTGTKATILRRLLRSKPGTRDRIALFIEVRIELEANEAAEERFLYVPMLMHDQGLDASRHALHEHHQIDELVEDVQSLGPAGMAWLQTAKELSRRIHHHLHEESAGFSKFPARSSMIGRR